MSGIIPKETLGGFQRWQVGDFNPRPATAPVAMPVVTESQDNADSSLVVNDVPLPTAEDIEQIHEQARTEGYQAGYAEGQEKARDEAAALIADTGTRMAEMIGHLQVALAQMDQNIAEQVLDLALEISSQIVRGSISVKRDSLLSVIREALAALPLHHGHVTLHLNPGDAEAVREQMGEQLAQTGTQLIPDATITAGGCTLRAGASEVDATLETRWKRVIEAIGVEPKDWLETP
ncbi:flagellar assembly protein FliH [Dechloromonas sp.]|uniref:flagellar assembly protein FliH n=1 Tax=Dechloromonas sp. TaxID=1917218 RepID=UPI00216E0383|nr:flagellar assembly protein FliH [Dechloromonas sp.]MBU3696431.1 flagellar assembly protein FliH [Dechloromonas sp.]